MQTSAVAIKTESNCNTALLLFEQHLEHVIKSRIPGIQSLINKTVLELESELSRLGKPIAADAGVRFCILFFFFNLYSLLDIKI